MNKLEAISIFDTLSVEDRLEVFGKIFDNYIGVDDIINKYNKPKKKLCGLFIKSDSRLQCVKSVKNYLSLTLKQSADLINVNVCYRDPKREVMLLRLDLMSDENIIGIGKAISNDWEIETKVLNFEQFCNEISSLNIVREC